MGRAPPTVTLGLDLQQGSYYRTRLPDRIVLLPFLAAANPQTFSTSLYPPFPTLCTLPRRGTRADLQLVLKMPR